MKSKFKICAWLTVVILMMACSFSFNQVTVPTASAVPPTEPPTQTASPSANGSDISYSGTSFTLPKELGTGTSNEVKPEDKADLGIPYLAHPAYTYIQLQGYPLQGKLFEPHISVYPITEYVQVNENVSQAIDELRNTLTTQNIPPDKPIPFLPFENAAQVFHAQEKFISFQNGMGIRYITQFDQAPLPINNKSMFYTFQGLTNDGECYISVIMPVNLNYLPTDDTPNSPTPEGGIPFDWEHIENFTTYQTAIVEKLRNTPDNAFTPSLTALDDLIETLSVIKQ